MSVQDLRRDERRAAVDLLADAFAADPLFVTCFGPAPESAVARRRARCFVSFVVAGTGLLGGHRRVIRDGDGHLAGVALVEPPLGRWSRAFRGALAAVRFLPVAFLVPPATTATLNRYARACRELAPSRPHHYLTMVGVRPDRRGTGCGRLLVEDVIALAEADPASAGVGLDTENEANLALYERFGFRVLGTVDLGACRAHVLFRPRRSVAVLGH